MTVNALLAHYRGIIQVFQLLYSLTVEEKEKFLSRDVYNQAKLTKLIPYQKPRLFDRQLCAGTTLCKTFLHDDTKVCMPAI